MLTTLKHNRKPDNKQREERREGKADRTPTDQPTPTNQPSKPTNQPNESCGLLLCLLGLSQRMRVAIPWPKLVSVRFAAEAVVTEETNKANKQTNEHKNKLVD